MSHWIYLSKHLARFHHKDNEILAILSFFRSCKNKKNCCYFLRRNFFEKKEICCCYLLSYLVSSIWGTKYQLFQHSSLGSCWRIALENMPWSRGLRMSLRIRYSLQVSIELWTTSKVKIQMLKRNRKEEDNTFSLKLLWNMNWLSNMFGYTLRENILVFVFSLVLEMSWRIIVQSVLLISLENFK